MLTILLIVLILLLTGRVFSGRAASALTAFGPRF
jgi:hypothetical protein